MHKMSKPIATAYKRKKISEARKRKIVKKIIREELLIVNKFGQIHNMVVEQEERMLREGYSRAAINEGIGDFLAKIPAGFTGYIKQYFVEMIMRKFGFDPESLLGYAFKNIIEQMEWMHITKYFGKGGCRPLTDVIMQGLTEAVAEKGVDALIKMLFGPNRSATGFLTGTAREMAMEALQDMTEGLRKPIEDFICTLDLSDMTSGLASMFGGGDKAGNPLAKSPFAKTGSKALPGTTPSSGGGFDLGALMQGMLPAGK